MKLGNMSRLQSMLLAKVRKPNPAMHRNDAIVAWGTTAALAVVAFASIVGWLK